MEKGSSVHDDDDDDDDYDYADAARRSGFLYLSSFPPHFSSSVFVVLFFFLRPTAENLIPIRVDVEVDGQRFKDAFTWNPSGMWQK